MSFFSSTRILYKPTKQVYSKSSFVFSFLICNPSSKISSRISRSVGWATWLELLVWRYYRVRTTVWLLYVDPEEVLGKKEWDETRILCAILNISRKPHFTKQQLYVHLPPISQTIKVRRARYAGCCWRFKGELISDRSSMDLQINILVLAAQ